ncbi:MAG: DUF4386 domain-containing protein [Chloroflexota bacterium]|nr:DUF4386 domain-containing protein [Chloroflexota bacterium]
MAVVPAIKTSSSAEPVAASLKKSRLTGSLAMDSRLIGALYLAGFLVYGVGSILVKSVTGASDFLSTISAHQPILLIGSFLMFLNTGVDVGKGVLFFPILENHGKRTALGYLAAMIVEVVLLDVGVLALLMIIPLGSQHGVVAGTAQAFGSLAAQANSMAYQVAQISLAVGSIFLCVLLFRTQLIPRWLAVSGLIGYPILMAGAIAEIFGLHIGTILTIPGIFFELALPFWLFTKGFQSEAYRGQPVVPPAT